MLTRSDLAKLALQLDAIDPDWASKFLTTDAAIRFYRDELLTPDSQLAVEESISEGLLNGEGR